MSDKTRWVGGVNILLEITSVDDVNDLGHDEGLGGGLGTGLSDGGEGGEDSLEKGGGGTLGDVRLLAGILGVHLGGALLGSSGDSGDVGGRGGGGVARVLDVDVDADDGDLALGGLPNHVHLHGAAHTVVEVLAGEVEVELLEGEVDAVDGHGAALGDDLDGGTEVLELGAGGEVGDVNAEGGGGHELELALGHVDGGLAGSGGAEDVGGVEGDPVEGAL